MVRSTSMDLFERREKLFDIFERGIITRTEVFIMFVGLMLDADSDATAISLCRTSPEWFRELLRDQVEDRVQTGAFERRWFGMGDPRSSAQVVVDAIRHGSILRRLSSEILAAI